MEPYDPNKRYFGPQGSKLCAIIPEYPKGIPQARPVFNYAGYLHDGGYTGERRSGFMGWLWDAKDRYQIDKEMLANIKKGTKRLQKVGGITKEEAEECIGYGKLAYGAIRLGGWNFFRVSDVVDE